MKQQDEGYIVEMTEYEGQVIISVAYPPVAVSIILEPEEARQLSYRLLKVYAECFLKERKEGVDR